MALNHEHMEEAPENNGSWRVTGDEVFRYCECTKNQARAVNLQAVDGCLEFMPEGEEGTLEALSCAACGCHRNFHRKEPAVLTQMSRWRYYYQHTPSGHIHMVSSPQTPYHQQSRVISAAVSDPSSSRAGGKRFRTRFTQYQKDRMLAFAQEIGWRVKKENVASVNQLCREIGINRNVLKVWFRNNKHTLGKMN